MPKLPTRQGDEPKFKTRIGMTTTLCRLDAFSESSVHKLRGKFVPDWSEFLKLLLENDSNYFGFWEGFNIPVLHQFHCEFSLNPGESSFSKLAA